MAVSEVTASGSPDAPGQARADGRRRELIATRAGLAALFLAAAASVVYLSFSSGGYFPNTTGFAAIVLAQALVLRTTLAERPFEGFGWALNIPLGALALYTGWELASTLWSPTPARALDAYDRSLLYLLAFTLFGSLAHTARRLRWLIAVLTVAMAGVCIAGLITRVFPHAWPTAAQFAADRLNYPLSYWNGEGMLAAATLILAVHLASDTEGHWSLRLFGAAVAPPVAAALLLTFSRGGVGVAVVGVLAYVALARPRGIVGAAVALGPTVAISLRAAYDANLLASSDTSTPAAVAQGRHVALVVVACMAGAVLLRAALLPVDARLRRTAWPGALGDPRRRRGVAAVAAVLAVIVAVVLGGPALVQREYHGFVHSDPHTSQLRDRFTNVSNNARLGLWRSAVRTFDARKLAGYGAGAYQAEYTRYRPVDETQYVTDAHSLYLQSMAELGLIGLVLILLFVFGVLGGLATRIRGTDRAAPAALLAAGLAWAIHALVDWDWQLPATSLWLFMAGGLALARARGRSRFAGVPRNRTVLAVAWLALAVAPALVSISYSRLASSARAVARNDCVAAKREAFSSISALAVRPQAYVAIGICDLRQGFPTAAVAAMQKALHYNRDSWQEQYWLAVARAAQGVDPRSAAQRAYAENRYEPLAASLVHMLGSADPRSWERAAPQLQSAALASGLFSLSAP